MFARKSVGIDASLLDAAAARHLNLRASADGMGEFRRAADPRPKDSARHAQLQHSYTKSQDEVDEIIQGLFSGDIWM